MLVEYKGTYTQYVDARARDEARQAKVAEHQAAEIRRLSTLAASMRHQTAKRARVAKTLDKRVARLQASAVQAPARPGAPLQDQLPSAAPLRPRRPRSERVGQGLQRAAGVRGRDLRCRARPAPPRHGPQRRGQDQPPAPPGRPERADGGSLAGRRRRVCRVLRAGARRHRRRPHGRRPPTRAVQRARGRAARSVRACSASSGTRRSRTRRLFRGGEDEAGVGPARGRPAQLPLARRAHQQPGPTVTPGHRHGPFRVAGAPWSS